MYEKPKQIAVGDRLGWWRMVGYNDIAMTDQWTVGIVVDMGTEWATMQDEDTGKQYRLRLRKLCVVPALD